MKANKIGRKKTNPKPPRMRQGKRSSHRQNVEGRGKKFRHHIYTKHRTFNDYDDQLRLARSTFQIDQFLDERIGTGVPLKWAEAGCGLGICLSLANLECPGMIEGYGVDLVEWRANNISEKERKELAQAYGEHTDSLLQNRRFTFIKGDLKAVILPKPVDLVTSFFVLQYHDDPLGAWCHLFNQLAPHGVIAAHLLIPRNDQSLLRFYQRAMKELQGQGVEARCSYYVERRPHSINVFLVATRRTEQLEFLLDISKVRETTVGIRDSIPLRIKRVFYRTPEGKSSRLNCWRVVHVPKQIER